MYMYNLMHVFHDYNSRDLFIFFVRFRDLTYTKVDRLSVDPSAAAVYRMQLG